MTEKLAPVLTEIERARERVRQIAIKELEKASRPVAFLKR